MTTDSLEEARDRLHKAIDDRADCLVIEALVDGVVAAARGGEVIREVEALVKAARALIEDCDVSYAPYECAHHDYTDALEAVLEPWEARLRVLSQGGEGNGDNT